MDLKDVAVFVVTILIGVVSWASDRKKRKEARQDSRPETPHRAATPANPLFEAFAGLLAENKPRTAPPPVRETVMEPKKQSAPQTVSAKPVNTAAPAAPQKKEAQPRPEETALRPLSRDSLRNAIIWGEILQRKF